MLLSNSPENSKLVFQMLENFNFPHVSYLKVYLMFTDVVGPASLKAQKLTEAIDYDCEGEGKFTITINEDVDKLGIKDLHLRICKSSWSNMWCSGPNSYFIERPCRTNVSDSHNRSTCVLNKPTLCSAVKNNGFQRNWYHGVYVVKIVGNSAEGTVSSKVFAISPRRYQFSCSVDFLLGYPHYNKLCPSSSFQ